MLREVPSSDALRSPRARPSAVTLRANVVMAGVAAGVAWLFHGVGYEGNTVPEPPTAAIAALGSDLPPPDADIEVILHALDTPERFNAFLAQHYAYDAAQGFCNQFENTPAEFQAAGWRGPCSTGAVFFCEWALRRGWSPSIVNTAPVGTAKLHTAWHQMGLVRFAGEQGKEVLWIYDNGIKVWEGSLDAYVEESTGGKQALLPIGGTRPYMRMRPNFRSRFLSNIGANTEPVLHPLPYVPPPVPVVVATGS